MGKSCANERNESPLSYCRVQPTFSMRKKGLGESGGPSLKGKGGLVGFRRSLKVQRRTGSFSKEPSL